MNHEANSVINCLKLNTISVVLAVVVDEVEDRSVAHLAFLNANQMSQPQDLRIPGMQDFAAAVRPQTFRSLSSRNTRISKYCGCG